MWKKTMACNCVHHKEDIKNDFKTLTEFRELFIKRMTEDSKTKDRRRKDYNQAIFFWDDYHQEHHPVFYGTTMEMILKCFDDALKDYLKTYCDVSNCNRITAELSLLKKNTGRQTNKSMDSLE